MGSLMPPADSTPELKPCPFCGEIPEGRIVPGTRPRRWKIECDDEDCDAIVRVLANTPEEAEALWNRRTP